VTDNATGCTAVSSVTVTEPAPVVVAQDTVINVNCGNAATGALQVSATGGTPGYTYNISQAGIASNTTGIFTNLGAGTYTITATDVNGCESTTSVTISGTTPIDITLTATNITCSGSEDGLIVADVTGGLPFLLDTNRIYTYNWTGPNGNIVATDSVTNIGPGLYRLTVQDSVGCFDTASITVVEPQPIVVSAVTTPASCGNNDGSIVLSATGGPSALAGTPNNYEYSIDGGATFVSSNTFNNLASGFYDIVVRDAGVTYCIGLFNVDLGSNSDLTGSITTTNPACDNLNSGSATVFATSPAGGYTYRWFTDDNFITLSTTNTLSNAVGNVRDDNNDGTLDTLFNYIVVVTDANGCEYTDTAYIITPERPTIGTDVGAGFVQDVDCNGGNNGVIQIGIDGDTTGYTYFWNTGATTSQITGLSTMGADSANYIVTVTDPNGCVASDTVALFQPEDPVTAFYTGSTVACANQATGTITLDSIYGGTAPYLFAFGPNGPFGGDAILSQGLRAGVYTVHTQDLNGCIDSVENIIVRDTIDYQVTAYQDQTITLGDSVFLYGTVNSTLTGADSTLVSWSQIDPNTGLSSTILVGSQALTGFTPPIFYTDMQFVLSLNNGCGDSSIVNIEVDKQQTVFIPDAFSPNGDGTNDVFTIYASSDVERIETFMVFDRWGEMIHIGEDFEPNSIDPDHGWDGTFRGQAMNPAVFVYYAEIRLADGTKIVRKGDVTLVR
jgi:gliding motility-associated-like protein